jgi:hypothetical protein
MAKQLQNKTEDSKDEVQSLEIKEFVETPKAQSSPVLLKRGEILVSEIDEDEIAIPTLYIGDERSISLLKKNNISHIIFQKNCG